MALAGRSADGNGNMTPVGVPVPNSPKVTLRESRDFNSLWGLVWLNLLKLLVFKFAIPFREREALQFEPFVKSERPGPW